MITVVEAVKRTVEPEELVAIMRATKCLPTSSEVARNDKTLGLIPDTATGVLELVVLLSPSCPELLRPQHLTEPFSSSAQECALPPVMAVADEPSWP